MATKTEAQYRADVLSDWMREKDRATIRRRHPKATSDEDCIEREIRMRVFLNSLPTTWKK